MFLQMSCPASLAISEEESDLHLAIIYLSRILHLHFIFFGTKVDSSAGLPCKFYRVSSSSSTGKPFAV